MYSFVCSVKDSSSRKYYEHVNSDNVCTVPVHRLSKLFFKIEILAGCSVVKTRLIYSSNLMLGHRSLVHLNVR